MPIALSRMAMLKVENCPSNKLAFTNRIFLSKTDFARLKGARARDRATPRRAP